MSGRVAKVRAGLERGLSSALARLPDAALTRLVRPAPPVDGNELDPHVALLLFLAERLVGPRPWEVPIEDARTEFARQSAIVTESPRHDVVTEDGVVPGPEGNIPVRVVRPRSARGPRPGVVYFHGGGWVLGSRTTHQGLCERLAADADCVVVSVDYRLAPEHRFPAAWVDAVAAYRHVASHAATYGIAPGKVAVAGDSAGGNLSAGVCIAARDAGDPMPLAQLLIYPATDLRRTMASHRTFAHGYFLDDPTMTWFLAQYTPDASTRDDPRASPLYAKDLSGLPHAIVVTAGFDPLRDEGKAYADRLRDAGVPVAYVCHGGHVHGFASMTHAVPSARRAVAAMVRDFATALRSPSLRDAPLRAADACHVTCAVIAGRPTFSYQPPGEARARR